MKKRFLESLLVYIDNHNFLSEQENHVKDNGKNYIAVPICLLESTDIRAACNKSATCRNKVVFVLILLVFGPCYIFAY